MTPPESPPSRRRGLTLRWKFVGLCGASMALVAAALAIPLVVQSRAALADALAATAGAHAHQLATHLAYEVFSHDVGALQRSSDKVRAETPGIAYVLFRDADEAPIALSRAEDLPDDLATTLGRPAIAAGQDEAQWEVEAGGLHVLEISHRVVFNDSADAERFLLGDGGEGSSGVAREVGTVQIGFRAEGLASRIAAITVRSLLIALAVFVACVAAVAAVAGRLTRPLERLQRAAAGVATGDLRQQVATAGSDDVAALAGSFQAMSEGLRGMAIDLQRAAAEVEQESGRILATATQQAAMAAQQASAITETSTTVTEIAQTSKQATEHADNVIHIAQKSEELSQEGERAVEQAKLGIEKLGEQVKEIALTVTRLSERTIQIGEIIATVKDVAEQSNILALNAAIEASKAGEQGRGFAVVASEMRNLAEQSKVAAAQVRAILGEIQAGTRAAADATEEGRNRARAAMALAQSAGESIVGLAHVIRETSLAARQIANNTRQQTIGVEQIVAAIGDLSGAMNESVEGTRDIEKVTASLTTVSKRLSGMLTRYQV
jgi:methyl-accepting chemotaxis protein